MPRDYPFVGGDDREQAVRAWLAAGAPSSGVEARPASTVLLVRDGVAGTGPEVVMLQRAATMAFAASMHAFPGGGVDPVDARADLPSGLVERAAAAMEVSEVEARSHLAAAVREVAEETGIDLAPEALVPLSRWVTPVFDRRRFDTWVLAAALPQGAVLRPSTTEAVTMEWVGAAQMLAAFTRREVLMLPPTIRALEQLVEAGDIASYLRTEADPRPVLPTLVETPDGIRLRVEP